MWRRQDRLSSDGPSVLFLSWNILIFLTSTFRSIFHISQIRLLINSNYFHSKLTHSKYPCNSEIKLFTVSCLHNINIIDNRKCSILQTQTESAAAILTCFLFPTSRLSSLVFLLTASYSTKNILAKNILPHFPPSLPFVKLKHDLSQLFNFWNQTFFCRFVICRKPREFWYITLRGLNIKQRISKMILYWIIVHCSVFW